MGRKLQKGINDLKTWCEQNDRIILLDEWNYEKNVPLSVDDVSAGSRKKVWWKCSNGHEWQSSISDRAKQRRGCPYCTGQKVITGVNDLLTLNPELANEWNYERNKYLKDGKGRDISTPNKVMTGTKQKVWWKCSKGHEWVSTISKRSSGDGCPYCSGRLAIIGVNDLATINPDLAKEWNIDKNAPLKACDVLPGSNKKVWWKCSKGHEWQAIIISRSRGNGCPVCSNHMIVIGVNDLSTTNPKLASEWNYDKNGALKPTDVVEGSTRKVWWKCSEGHEWFARIDQRSKDHGCPYCSGRNAVMGENDFATLNPEIAKEWNYEKNVGLKPSDFTRRSGQKVWWKCSKGHEWQASMHNRSGGHGCPYCAGLKAIVGYNDLLTLKPSYLEEWDYDKNIGISPSEFTTGSGKKVWWTCKYGHVWQSAISDRTRGNECPRCQYKGTSKPEQGIVFYLSECCKTEPRALVNKQEIDIYLPDYKIGIEYDGRFYHKNSQLKEAKKNEIIKEAGIVLLRIKESTCNSVSDNTIYFETDYLGPNYVWALHAAFNLIADLTGKDEIRHIDIDINRDALKIREQYDLMQKENSLAVKHPEIAKEWNQEKNGILTPDMFYSGSSEKVWWKCSKGHEWQSIIYSRVYGTGCPYCSGRKAINGETDFETLNPELVKEWDYDKNGYLRPSEYTISSSAKVWWKCSKGHEWQNTLHSRTSGHGCPYCAGKLVWPGFNDLASIRPDIAKEWNYEKNTGLKNKKGQDISTPDKVTETSGQYVYWKCSKGHEWKTTVANRTKGDGCPFCSGKKVLVGFNDLATIKPNIAEEWNYEKNGDSTPSDFTVGSSKKVWWKCINGHEWESIIVNRTKHGRGCPFCAGQRAIPGINDLATLRPDIAKEWNYARNGELKPENVMIGSGKKVWWKCINGHEWETTVNTRSGGGGCPYCAQNKSKKVICVETGAIYDSLAEARRQTGAKNISACCVNERNTSGGYHWRYLD